MRICIRKSDKHILEMQSHATAGTLIQNAINAGYTADQVEERVVDEAGYETVKLEDPVEIAAQQVAIDMATVQAAKAQAFLDNLPSWATVSNAIDAADTIPKLRAIIMKLARVTYWIARDKAD